MRAFLFDVDAWLSSTDVQMMTLAEQGAYLRLLLHSWKQPDCGLPDEDEVLAALSGLGSGWAKSSPKIRRCFHAENGRIYNERLLKERQVQEAYHARQAAAANARWGRPANQPLKKEVAENKRASRKTAMPRHIPPHMPDAMPEPSREHAIKTTAYAVVNNTYTAAANTEVEEATADAAATPPPPAEELGKLLQACMPPGTPAPDGELLRQAGQAIGSASLQDVAVVLQDYRRRRRPPQSYGFWPLYLRQHLPLTPALPPSQESATVAPACAVCGGSGVPGIQVACAEEARKALDSGAQLCGCQTGRFWAQFLADDGAVAYA